MIRTTTAKAAIAVAAILALWGTTRPLSYLTITLNPDELPKEFVTTGWSTNFDEHGPLFGVPIALAALLLAAALAWPKGARQLAFAGTATLLGALGVLLVYLVEATRFHREGNLQVDPNVQSGFGDGVWFLGAALGAAVLGTALHPNRARRASPVPRAP